MKDNVDVKELINNFIVNVETDDAHEQVLITIDELLYGKEELPIIHSASHFVSVLIGYCEYKEEYELCAELVKNRIDIEGKLIPLPQYCTKNHELLKALRKRSKRDNFGYGENFGL
jgi:hypothetical protein